MNTETLNLLLEYINARVAEHEASDSSDHGLIERIRKDRIEGELRKLVREDQ